MGPRKSDSTRDVVPVSVIFIFAVVCAAGFGTAEAGAVSESDVCADDGAAKLTCGAGHVVHVHAVRCVDGSHDCAPFILDTLFALCEGRASCALLGLKDVFSVHCHSSLAWARRLVVRFSCEHGPSPAPACRANLCSKATRVLTCPRDSLMHVRNLSCNSGLDPCSPATFLTLYTLCEGRGECDASGLRMLTPCGQPVSAPQPVRSQVTNIFFDYLCVPRSVVYSKCNGQYQRLTEPFGVMMNPGFTGSVSSMGMQCNWFVSPENRSKLVHLTVHMAYSKQSTDNCSTDFLQVSFKDCVTGESRTRQFCDLQHVNSRITSCGPVRVSSWSHAAADRADRFLVSYQIVPKGSGLVTPGGMSPCHTATVTPLPPTITTRPTLARRNYGPGGTMFDYSDTIRQTGEDSKSDENPAKGTFQFKLVILYVFFGVVILALVIALVYVLISYRGISRRTHQPGDSSEKAALWRHDDTPLDTFNHNSHNSLTDTAVTSANHTNMHTPDTARTPDHNHVTSSPDSQIVSCTVHAESTDEESDQRHSGVSRVSSFLGNQDPELNDLLANVQPYSTLPSDGPRGGTLPRRWSGGSGGTMSSTRSSSFKANGDLGNIYEAIDGAQFHSLHRPGQRHSGHPHGPDGEHTPLVPPQPPPSPPLPPPPPPIAGDYEEGEEGPGSHIDHYIVNNDEYALVKKPRNKGSPGKAHSVASPSRRGVHPVSPTRSKAKPVSPSHRNAQPVIKSPTQGRNAEYTNMVHDADTDGQDNGDPTYDSVDFFRDNSGPVVGFRPTSGPYDRDRNSKSEPVSPSSGGTTKHRWDEL